MNAGVGVLCQGVVHIYSGRGKDIQDVVALRSLDLQLDAGEMVALLGPSGSGKSTVLGLLAGVLRPSAGRVVIGDRDIGRMPPRELARLRGSMIATVLQEPARNLLPYATVRENVQFAAAPGAGLAPDELLDQLGLGGFAKRVAGRLSAGEQQRAAIGAAVAAGAGLLLADEPTSYLDAESRDDVLQLLSTVNAELGATVLVVTHDPLVAARMQRTVTIRDGRVGAEGRHGTDFAVIGRDGTLQLPPDLLAHYQPGTLVELEQHPDHLTLRPRRELQ